jgi:hypothetical protein
MKILKPEVQKKNNYNLRLSDRERKIIEEKANKYTLGNRSAYIRYAALNFTPKDKDLIRVDKIDK